MASPEWAQRADSSGENALSVQQSSSSHCSALAARSQLPGRGREKESARARWGTSKVVAAAHGGGGGGDDDDGGDDDGSGGV